jgi:hypothetical protein
MRITRHYEVPEWADFVRGLGDDAQRSAMQQHLSAGCARCGEFVATLQRFAPIAACEAQYEPPAQAVLRAEAVFQPQAHAARSRVARESVTSSADGKLAGKTRALA